MTSAIDPTKPVEGNATTASVRANFATAKSEIEALQTATTIPVVYNKNALPLPAGIAALALQIGEADGVATRAQLDAFSNACQYAFRRANGTNASKTALLSGNSIGNFAAHGYGATAYGSGSRIAINFQAAENWSDSAQGTQLEILTTKNGTTALDAKLRIGNDRIQCLYILLPPQHPTSSAPAYVKGAIYFDTTLNKLRIGGATAWETITSV